jgi:tetratricopeptide (TPR) repeat protein
LLLLLPCRGRAYKDWGFEAESQAIAQAEKAITETRAIQEELKKKDIVPEKSAALEQTLASKDAGVTAGEETFAKSPGYGTAAGGYWLSRGNLDKAVSSVDRALEHSSPKGDKKLTSKALTIKGLAVFQRHDYEAAYKAGKTAHALDPKNDAAFELMMYAESALRLRDVGEVVGKRAERIFALADPGVAHTPEEWANRYGQQPTEAGGLVVKAIRSRNKGDLGAELAYAEAAVKAAPSDPMAYFQRGRALYEKKDYNGAMVDFNQAMSLGWKDSLMYKLRAEALLKAGNYREAYLDALMAAAYKPDFAEAYVLRGQARLKMAGEDAEGIVRVKAEVMADMDKAARLSARLTSARI